MSRSLQHGDAQSRSQQLGCHLLAAHSYAGMSRKLRHDCASAEEFSKRRVAVIISITTVIVGTNWVRVFSRPGD